MGDFQTAGHQIPDLGDDLHGDRGGVCEGSDFVFVAGYCVCELVRVWGGFFVRVAFYGLEECEGLFWTDLRQGCGEIFVAGGVHGGDADEHEPCAETHGGGVCTVVVSAFDSFECGAGAPGFSRGASGEEAGGGGDYDCGVGDDYSFEWVGEVVSRGGAENAEREGVKEKGVRRLTQIFSNVFLPHNL